jgi:hypothetical protein
MLKVAIDKFFEVTSLLTQNFRRYGGDVAVPKPKEQNIGNGIKQDANLPSHPFSKTDSRFAAYFNGVNTDNTNESPLPSLNTSSEMQELAQQLKKQPTPGPQPQPRSAPTFTPSPR